MTFNPLPAFRGPRAALVGGLLVLTLGLAAMLAYQAATSARSHKAVADGVLRDYAGSATWEYTRRLSKELDGIVALTIKMHGAPAALKKRGIDPVLGTFTLDAATGRVLESTIELPPDGHHRIASMSAVVARGLFASASDPMIVLAGPLGRRRIFAFMVVQEKHRESRSVLGFETTQKGLEDVCRRVFEREPLLPLALTRGTPNAQMLTMWVGQPLGADIFKSAESPFAAKAQIALDGRLGGFYAQGQVRADAAGRLVVGGLPKSKLPFVLGLLAVTVVLIAAALLQLRREYELARLRTEFVSCVSHELRTPLAQIRLFGETLLLGRIRSDDERRRALEIIDQEARRLTHLVENVLLFSRSERKVSRLTLELALLAPVVHDVIEAFAPLARARRVEILTTIASDTITARFDRSAVQQILLNLIDNAVKYGPDAQTVTIGLAAVDGYARMWVEDQGPGIPTGERKRVWEPYCRAERERTSGIAGTGIGLAVVRELVQLHGGRATMESGAAGGSRFIVELPLP